MGKNAAAVIILLMILCPGAWAQRQDVGMLSGTVTDSRGLETMAGVTVAVKSPALILPAYTTLSGANGEYHFPDLPPGTYDVTFQLEGFRTLVQGVRIHALRVTTLDVRLSPRASRPVVVAPAPTVSGEHFQPPAPVQPEVQAPAEAPVAEPPAPALPVAESAELPALPALHGLPSGGLPSPELAAAQAAQPEDIGTLVLVRPVRKPLPEIAEEVVVLHERAPLNDLKQATRISTWPHDWLWALPGYRSLAAYLDMLPGMVDGSDQQTVAHGSSSMDNAYYLNGVRMVDPVTSTAYGPFFDFNLDAVDELAVSSGPLGAEYGQARGAVINVITRPGGDRLSGSVTFNISDKSLRADNTSGTPLAGQENGSKYDYQAAVALAGKLLHERLWFAAGGNYLERSTEVAGFPYDQDHEVANVDIRPSAFLKLTLQPRRADRFSFSYSYGNLRQENLNASPLLTEDGTVKQKNQAHALDFQWNRMVNDNLWTQLSLSLVKFDMDLTAKVSQPMYQEFLTKRYSGGFWRNQDLNARNRFSLLADTGMVMDSSFGTHLLQAGLGMEQARVKWTVKTLSDPITGAAINYTLNGTTYMGVVLLNDGFDRQENENDMYAYLQDAWTVNRRLTLRVGVRLQKDSVVWPAQNQDEGPLTMLGKTYNRGIAADIKPVQWTNLLPRVSGVFDLTGDGLTLVKAGWSRYVAPDQVGWVNAAHPNGLLGYSQIYNPDGTPAGLAFPWAVAGGITVGYNGSKLKAPYTDELVLGLERQFGRDWTVGARYISKKDHNPLHIVDAAQLDIEKLLNSGELDWSRNWTEVTATNPLTNQPISFWEIINPNLSNKYLVNLPQVARSYSGLEFTASKRFGNRLGLEASYVHAKSSGLIGTARGLQALGISTFFSDPNAHTNATGRLELDSSDQIKVLAIYNAPLGFNLSAYFRRLSGFRWTPTISSNDKATGLTRALKQGVTTIFAETRGNRTLPATNLLDLHVEKVFRISNLNLSVFADVFNLFNQGIATSVWTDASVQAVHDLGEMLTISAPRTIQVGLRFEFNR